MIEMGRPKTVWQDLPPRMAARRLASRKVLYYYQARGKKIPLGENLLTAKQEWARLETGGVDNSFPAIVEQYRKAVFPNLAHGSKKHYDPALRNLETAFRTFSIEQIQPHDVKQYIGQRSKKGAAKFEKSVLSALFTWARELGITNVPNPCAGMALRGQGGSRKRYVTDAEFSALREFGDEVLQDTMDLALYTGQRPSDILKAMRQDIKEGVLWVVQQKTGATVGIRVEEGLQRVIERIVGRKRPSMYLISNRHGQRVPYSTLNKKFATARTKAGSDWQFRDIRAKAGSDSPTLKDAQLLLGHSNEQTTASVYRRGKGSSVGPLKRQV